MLIHSPMMGQPVPLVKDNVSPDWMGHFRHIHGMTGTTSPQGFQSEFRARLRSLRKEVGWTQEEMATALGIGFEAYKKYETRSMLPHHLIPRFALLVRRDIQSLFASPAPKSRRREVSRKRESEVPELMEYLGKKTG